MTTVVDTGIALEARELTLEFSSRGGRSVRALAGLSLAARRGQVTGIVGPDGAGKTTLLRTAAGLLAPTGGRLTVLGFDAAVDIDPIRSRIGYMPQQFGLYEDLSVQENLELYADLRGLLPAERPERFDRLLQMTGLDPFTDRRAGRLSGGMKQKLGLACCLVRSPELLILDEPTVGVDPVSRRDLWRIVYELVAERGIGVVLSTAYLDEAERCDHVVLLHEGAKLDEGPPAHFHEQVRDRVYLVTPAAGYEPREVQAALARRADVIDATIRSGRIRAVFAPRAEARQPGIPDRLAAAIEPVEPVFEDAFVDRLARAGVGRDAGDSPSHGKQAAAAAEDEIVVRVRDLTKQFGDFRAVAGVGFEVRRGEVFGLLGPNGAGKSTTFRMLCGLLPATAGEISVAGYDLRRSPAVARSRLGYMAQKFSLYQQLTVRHNLRFYGRAYGLGGKHLRARIAWALDEFDLRDHVDLAAGGLPGGYRQRLAMAVAMLHEPDILFLDEPTSGADPLTRREFWSRISGFAGAGVTVIVTTHFMEEAEFCDRMLILSRGETLAGGTPHEIRMLARTEENPEPTVEDAFVALAEGEVRPGTEGRGHG